MTAPRESRPVLQLEGNLVAFDLDEPGRPRVVLVCPRCMDETALALDELAPPGEHAFPCGHAAARLTAPSVRLLLSLLEQMRHLSGTLPSRCRRPHERFERRRPS